MDTLLKSIVTIGALTVLVVRLALIKSSLGAFDWGLLGIAVLPWMSQLINVAIFGEWRRQFRELQDEQEKQKTDLARLRFLTAHHVTPHEREHLKKLASGESFVFAEDSVTPFFETEMRRLLDSGLIGSLPGKGIGSLLNEGGDVNQHFSITDRGREYVRLREQLELDENQQHETGCP